jgi:hypothetical protein
MEERAALWTIGGVLVVLKLVVIGLVAWHAPRSADVALWLFLIFHWPFVLGGLFLAAAPLTFWVRLVRVRARRRQLQAQEWEIKSPARIS